MLNIERRTESGIVIILPGTEATGFSPVGRLTDQIFQGLKEQHGKGIDDDETMLGSRCAVDRGARGARIFDRARDCCGGVVKDTSGGVLISGRGGV